MLRSRIVPCLLIDNGALVKTQVFDRPKYVGDPINAVKIFNEKEADELIVLDISATKLSLGPNFNLIEKLAAECRMPLCYGGGINSIEQVIKKKVDHFAFPFGNLSSMSLRALQMARDNYKFVHSGLRGSNYQIPAENVLRRETIFPWDPKGFESAVLSGAGDSRFRRSLSVLDCWADEISKRAKP